MTIEISRYCDRCKKPISSGVVKVLFNIFTFNVFETGTIVNEDLCAKCYKSYKRWFKKNE